VAALAGVDGVDLSAIGLDNVELSLGGQVELDALLSDMNALNSDLVALRGDSLVVDTIDMGGIDHVATANVTQDQVVHLIDEGLHFAQQDFITLDVTAAQSTHLSTSLKDLSKLGIDTLHVTDTQNIADLGDLANSLKAAGLEHLGFFSSDFEKDASLVTKVENFDWVTHGIDFSLQVDAPAVAAPAPAPQDLGGILNMVQDGVDLLNVGLSDDATWGELIHTLQDAGLGNVEIESKASVSISDDLSAALYEAGMLHALPDASIEIDAGANKVLNTSLKAMADLGVDSIISTQDKLYVELGLKPEDVHSLADLHSLFAAFGTDTAKPTHLFADGQSAGLVVDHTTFDHLGEAGVHALVGELTKLGFTELDVVDGHQVDHVFNITPQTPVDVTVELLGTVQNDLGVFDPDILHKPTK